MDENRYIFHDNDIRYAMGQEAEVLYVRKRSVDLPSDKIYKQSST